MPVAAVYINELSKAQRPRPVLPAVRTDLSDRPDDDRAARRASRADARLAGHVSDRWHPRSGRDRAAAAAARIAALADLERTSGGGGYGNPRDRGERDRDSGVRDPGSRPESGFESPIPDPIPIPDRARRAGRALVRGVSRADAHRLDALGVRVLHHQRAEQLDADAVQQRLSPQSRTGAARGYADQRRAGRDSARLRVRDRSDRPPHLDRGWFHRRRGTAWRCSARSPRIPSRR